LSAGITGGFAPPTPDAIYTITQPKGNPSLKINAAERPHGTPSLQSFADKDLTADEHTHLIDELHSILKTLPTESPPGSEDIYGLNIGIAWGSDDLEWCNGSPQGCSGGFSDVKATDEEKAKFQRAVDIIEELVGHAKA